MLQLLAAPLRHQDAVVEFERTTGELSWILAPDVGWSGTLRNKLLRPQGADFRQPYHQHAAALALDGQLLMFDNRNYEASAFQDPTPGAEIDSRAVAFTVDELGHSYTGIPGIEGQKVNMHDVGHGKTIGGLAAEDIRARCRHHHMTLIDRMVARLKSVPEAGGTLFEAHAILHAPSDLPVQDLAEVLEHVANELSVDIELDVHIEVGSRS